MCILKYTRITVDAFDVGFRQVTYNPFSNLYTLILRMLLLCVNASQRAILNITYPMRYACLLIQSPEPHSIRFIVYSVLRCDVSTFTLARSLYK